VTPPWLQEPRLQRQFRTHSDTVVAHAPRAAGVSPPWDGKRTCKGASAIVRQTVVGALANAVAIALPQPLL